LKDKSRSRIVQPPSLLVSDGGFLLPSVRFSVAERAES